MKRDEIYHQYSWQFARGKGIDNSVPEAWLPAITDLCAKVAELIPGEQWEAFQWQDIKVKHGTLAVTYHAPAALGDAVASLVEVTESACNAHATIQLIKVTEYHWHDYLIPIWQPVDNQGKPLSGGIVFLEDMPEILQTQFKVWLTSQQLSISRPPLGLPRRSASYFAQDVVTALEQASAE